MTEVQHVLPRGASTAAKQSFDAGGEMLAVLAGIGQGVGQFAMLSVHRRVPAPQGVCPFRAYLA